MQKPHISLIESESTLALHLYYSNNKDETVRLRASSSYPCLPNLRCGAATSLCPSLTPSMLISGPVSQTKLSPLTAGSPGTPCRSSVGQEGSSPASCASEQNRPGRTVGTMLSAPVFESQPRGWVLFIAKQDGSRTSVDSISSNLKLASQRKRAVFPHSYESPGPGASAALLFHPRRP